MAHIPASAWETSRPIAISPDPISRGTAITIKVPDSWLKTLADDVANGYVLDLDLLGVRVDLQAGRHFLDPGADVRLAHVAHVPLDD